MALNPTASEYRLPCGRDVEQVWEHLDSPEDDAAHEASCPHCRAAGASLLVLREATGELAAEEVQPSAGLTGRIMAAVRADVRRRELVELPASEPGTVRISVPAAAAILRFAADTVEGVRARHCGVELDDDGNAVVELTIAVGVGEFAHDAMREVRDRVEAAARARIGWSSTVLHLTLADIFDE